MQQSRQEQPYPATAEAPPPGEQLHEVWIPRLLAAMFLVFLLVLLLGVIAEQAGAQVVNVAESAGPRPFGLLFLFALSAGIVALGLSQRPAHARKEE